MSQYPTKQYQMRTAISDPSDPLVSRWRQDNAKRIAAWESANAPSGLIPSILAEDGIHVMPAAKLVDPALLQETHGRLTEEVCTPQNQKKIEEVKARPWKDFVMMIRLDKDVMPKHPATKLACDPALLRAIAGYLGMWPRLADICVHVNYPTETEASASQLWHRDPGDIKVVKVFIYLCDVTMENGPFCYIKGTQPFGRHSHIEPRRDPNTPMVLEERLIRWTDEEIMGAFPEADYTVCTGTTHTMIIADTVGLHRGLKPESGGRILVCFTYTSGIPGPLHKFKDMPAWAKDGGQRWALK